MLCKEVEVVLEQEGWTPLPESARSHVLGCVNCKNLVADLTSIVAAAHMLPAEVDPPAHVWTSLAAQLEEEGIIKRPVHAHTPWWRGWSELFQSRVLAVTAVAAFIIAAVLLPFSGSPQRPEEARSYSDAAMALDSDEANLPAPMANASVVDVSLRQNLDIVDKFIADCEQRVKDQPQDELTREYLNGAYQQKAELLSAMMDRVGSAN